MKKPIFDSGKTFLISTFLTIFLFIAGLFIWMHEENLKSAQAMMLIQARSLHKSVMLAREWNNSLGGVYAIKSERVQSNPFLENPDIAAADGRVLTLKKPAVMISEISEFSQREGPFSFRMVGANPLNPRNQPNAFEQEALASFAAGAKEHHALEEAGGRRTYRYMEPVFIQESCMKCHAKQGYSVGDLKGGVSISFDGGGFFAKQQRNYAAFVGTLSLMAMLMLTLIFLYFKRMQTRVDEAQSVIATLAITDELSGIFNRRHALRRLDEELAKAERLGQPLSCILLDIDHFKQINDAHGHQAGDAVIVKLAALVGGVIRIYDIFARYGGEEFLLILPNTDMAKAVLLATRIQTLVEEKLGQDFDPPKSVTISQGISDMWPGDTMERILNRSDMALYRAKERGRNRAEAI